MSSLDTPASISLRSTIESVVINPIYNYYYKKLHFMNVYYNYYTKNNCVKIINMKIILC